MRRRPSAGASSSPASAPPGATPQRTRFPSLKSFRSMVSDRVLELRDHGSEQPKAETFASEWARASQQRLEQKDVVRTLQNPAASVHNSASASDVSHVLHITSWAHPENQNMTTDPSQVTQSFSSSQDPAVAHFRDSSGTPVPTYDITHQFHREGCGNTSPFTSITLVPGSEFERNLRFCDLSPSNPRYDESNHALACAPTRKEFTENAKLLVRAFVSHPFVPWIAVQGAAAGDALLEAFHSKGFHATQMTDQCAAEAAEQGGWDSERALSDALVFGSRSESPTFGIWL